MVSCASLVLALGVSTVFVSAATGILLFWTGTIAVVLAAWTGVRLEYDNLEMSMAEEKLSRLRRAIVEVKEDFPSSARAANRVSSWAALAGVMILLTATTAGVGLSITASLYGTEVYRTLYFWVWALVIAAVPSLLALWLLNTVLRSVVTSRFLRVGYIRAPKWSFSTLSVFLWRFAPLAWYLLVTISFAASAEGLRGLEQRDIILFFATMAGLLFPIASTHLYLLLAVTKAGSTPRLLQPLLLRKLELFGLFPVEGVVSGAVGERGVGASVPG